MTHFQKSKAMVIAGYLSSPPTSRSKRCMSRIFIFGQIPKLSILPSMVLSLFCLRTFNQMNVTVVTTVAFYYKFLNHFLHLFKPTFAHHDVSG